MNQHYLQLYADFIVKVGVNVRPRQNFIVRCPVTMPDFAHACVRAGYEAGAKTVVVRWEDDKLTRLNMELADEKDLTAMKPYELRSYLDGKGGPAHFVDNGNGKQIPDKIQFPGYNEKWKRAVAADNGEVLKVID